MNYSDTLNYLYERLPMFTRVGAAALKKDLTNTLWLSEKAGNPHRKFKTIHVAGTNGKGSVSHTIASVLQEAGYRTGLYTSPHLVDFRERIRINGEMIPPQQVVEFVEKYRDDIEEISPSFFEATVVMAFDFFANQAVDVAVIETGLGGRLDSTNIITPELSVITNISFDHMQLLGNTLPLIAAEKAGIIKEGVPVVIGETNAESAPVFIQKAAQLHAPVVFADQVRILRKSISEPAFLEAQYENVQTRTDESWKTDLPGLYQARNICTVLSAMDILEKNFPAITITAIRNGLLSVKANTGLMGRWEILHQDPLVVLDVGHNEDGIRQIRTQLNSTPHQQLHIIMGMVKDKDIHQVLTLLPKDAVYYFTNAPIPRALPAEALREQAMGEGLKGNAYPSVNEAVRAAWKNTGKKDLLLVCGSVFVVGEVDRNIFKTI